MTFHDAVNAGWIHLILIIIFICLLVQTIIRLFTCPACFSSCFRKYILSNKEQKDLDKIIDDDSKGNDVEMNKEYDRSVINETVKHLSGGINHNGSVKYGGKRKVRVEERRVVKRLGKMERKEVKRLGGHLSVSFADESWIKCDDSKDDLENIKVSPYANGLELDRPFITLKVEASELSGFAKEKMWGEDRLGLEVVVAKGCEKVEDRK